jgi:hypothetical protein
MQRNKKIYVVGGIRTQNFKYSRFKSVQALKMSGVW